MQRFIAWWVRNAVYIGPIAGSVSTLAALWSVRIATKSFWQARQDRREEIEANRPVFRISKADVISYAKVVGLGAYKTYYELKLVLRNSKPNSAKRIKIKVTIAGLEGLQPIAEIERELIDEVQEDESFQMNVDLKEIKPTDPHHIYIDLRYVDIRTSNVYIQTMLRFFQSPAANPSKIATRELDMSDVNSLAVNNINLGKKELTELLRKIDDLKKKVATHIVDNSH